jgi:hypothetical protein
MWVAGEKWTKEVFRSASGRCFGNKKSKFIPIIGGFGRFYNEIHLS